MHLHLCQLRPLLRSKRPGASNALQAIGSIRLDVAALLSRAVRLVTRFDEIIYHILPMEGRVQIDLTKANSMQNNTSYTVDSQLTKTVCCVCKTPAAAILQVPSSACTPISNHACSLNSE